MLKLKNIKWQNHIACLSLIFISQLLLSCGYQLQKPLQIDAAAQPIYIDGDLVLVLQLKRALSANGIKTSKTLSGAGSMATVYLTEDDVRSYSISGDGRNAETLRKISASIEWLAINNGNGDSAANEERTLLANSIVSTEMVQIQNPDNVAAQASESELQLEKMRAILAEKIINLMRYR